MGLGSACTVSCVVGATSSFCGTSESTDRVNGLSIGDTGGTTIDSSVKTVSCRTDVTDDDDDDVEEEVEEEWKCDKMAPKWPMRSAHLPLLDDTLAGEASGSFVCTAVASCCDDTGGSEIDGSGIFGVATSSGTECVVTCASASVETSSGLHRLRNSCCQ